MLQLNRGVMRLDVYTIFLVFIAGDILTGLLKAIYNGKISSECLRKGLIHKFTEILVVFGGGFLDYVMLKYLGVKLMLLQTFSIYVITMELISIIENLCEVNPSLSGLLKPYLEKLKDKDNEGN